MFSATGAAQIRVVRSQGWPGARVKELDRRDSMPRDRDQQGQETPAACRSGAQARISARSPQRGAAGAAGEGAQPVLGQAHGMFGEVSDLHHGGHTSLLLGKAGTDGTTGTARGEQPDRARHGGRFGEACQRRSSMGYGHAAACPTPGSRNTRFLEGRMNCPSLCLRLPRPRAAASGRLETGPRRSSAAAFSHATLRECATDPFHYMNRYKNCKSVMSGALPRQPVRRHVSRKRCQGSAGCMPTTTVRARTRENTPAGTSTGMDFTCSRVRESKMTRWPPGTPVLRSPR